MTVFLLFHMYFYVVDLMSNILQYMYTYIYVYIEQRNEGQNLDVDCTYIK